jgi:hypothetical protein
MDHDGKPELYLTGIDNEARMGTMIVLDIENLRGVSKQETAEYQILDMPLATERKRLYFHKSCISAAVEPYNYPARVVFLNDDIWVSVREQSAPEPGSQVFSAVDYDFSPDLKLREISLPDGFYVAHRHFEQRKILDHRFSKAELEPLKVVDHP